MSEGMCVSRDFERGSERNDDEDELLGDECQTR
jgi:hypothetical protein